MTRYKIFKDVLEVERRIMVRVFILKFIQKHTNNHTNSRIYSHGRFYLGGINWS